MQNEASPSWPWEGPFGIRVAAWLRSSSPAQEPDLLALSAGLSGASRQRGVAFVRALAEARRDAFHPWHRLVTGDSASASQLLGPIAQAFDVVHDVPSGSRPAGACASSDGALVAAAGSEGAAAATAAWSDSESLEQFERVVARMENLSPLGFKVATGMRKECFDLLLQKLGPQMGVTAGDAASAEAAATHLKLVLLFMRNGESQMAQRGQVMPQTGRRSRVASGAAFPSPSQACCGLVLPLLRRWQAGVYGPRRVAGHDHAVE